MDYSAGATSDLMASIVAVERLICAARREQLAMIAEVDGREGYREDHVNSMPIWLSMSLNVTEHAAREYVRVAHALDVLPNVADGFVHGDLSYQQVEQVTRMADASTDEHWAVEARSWSVRQLRLMADRARERSDAESKDAHERREVRWRWDEGGTMLRLHARLPEDAGATIVGALEAMAEQAPSDPGTGFRDAYRQRMADALYEVCSSGAERDADRATVVVHVDAGGAHLADAGPISRATAERLLCDGRVEVVAESDGRVVGVGRARRTVPAWLARQVRERDGGCRFPGCGRTRWTHVHHIVEWSRGGPTDLDNLCLLCPLHHRLVHELGWRIEGHPDVDLLFIAPDGSGELPLPEPDPASRERFERVLAELTGAPP